jgi:hypothetical protein
MGCFCSLQIICWGVAIELHLLPCFRVFVCWMSSCGDFLPWRLGSSMRIVAKAVLVCVELLN